MKLTYTYPRASHGTPNRKYSTSYDYTWNQNVLVKLVTNGSVSDPFPEGKLSLAVVHECSSWMIHFTVAPKKCNV